MEIKTFRILCILIFFVFAHGFIWADQVGSESFVSIIPYTNFSNPVSTQNEILAFGWMKNGFGMQDDTMSCTFASAFPVSGHLSLHGGRLELATDFVTNNPVTFASSGYIVGNNHVFDIAQSVTALPSAGRAVFKDTKVYFNGDLRIVGTVDLQGNCEIDGFGHRMVLDDGILKVGHNAVLTLKNLELDGIRNHNIYCLDDSACIILDNIRWVQTGDYTFSRGSLVVQNQVDFTGPFRFFYASSLTSTVRADSEWHCSDLVELTMGRSNGINGREPLYFEDKTAALKLENSSFVVTSAGMRFTRGAFLCDRQVNLDVHSTSSMNGFEIGDGTAENDLLFKLFPAATFKLNAGHLVYNVAYTENFLTDDINVKFHKANNAVFHSKQDIAFRNITIRNDGISGNTSNEGVGFTFDNVSYRFPFAEYRLTGKRYSNGVDLLRGNGDSLEVLSGTYPFGVRVKGTGSKILGTGFISGQIVLHDPSVSLSLNWDGVLSSNIVLNGGSLVVGKDLIFGQSVGFTGTGKINLGSRQVVFGTNDLAVTSSISWNSTGGRVKFQGGVNLHSEWVFKGSCILDGSGNELALRPTGKIKVAAAGTLHMKDMFISNLSDDQISCMSDSSKIIFDNVRIALDSDYSFSRGSLEILNNVDFMNAHTFFYQSALTSSIDRYSRWRFMNGIKVSLGRKDSVYGRDPLYFQDDTSVLEADKATFSVTSSGIKLTRGKFEVSNYLAIETASTSSQNGLILGNGVSGSDFTFLFNPGSTLNFKKGHFVYENNDPNRIKALTKLTRIIIDQGFKLYAQKSLNIKDLNLEFLSLWGAEVAPGAILQYKNTTFSPPGSEILLTGTRYSSTASLLDTNDKLTVVTGVVPLGTVVLGKGNVIAGEGNIGADVVLMSPLSELKLSLGGMVLANISLGGGSVTLEKPLIFGDNLGFKGTGKIDLGRHYVEFGGLDCIQTSSVDWSGKKGSVFLRSNLHLTSRWTFSGDCTIIGNGNTIRFSPSARMLVQPGSKIRLKNVVLENVLDQSIACVDNTGSIEFQAVVLNQNDKFVFDKGSFDVYGFLELTGSNTFVLQPSGPCTIRSGSTLFVDRNMTLSVDFVTTQTDLLVFEDHHARMQLNNAALHITSTGMVLTTGGLVTKGTSLVTVGMTTDSILGWPVERGLQIGNLSSDQDFSVEVTPGSKLIVDKGWLIYKNMKNDAWGMKNHFSVLQMNNQSTLKLYQPLDVSPGIVRLGENTSFLQASGNYLLGNVEIFKP